MKLTLEDKSVFEGESFGASVSVAGEVVFVTGMTGYVESLSDPSYAGQILVCTYPLIGNYGVPERRFFESAKAQVAGLVVGEYSKKYSHAKAKESLGEWLKHWRVPALTGVDTREITKTLRTRGVMLGHLSEGKEYLGFYNPNTENLVARVSCKKKIAYGKGKRVIVVVDCGIKENILRSLSRSGITLIRVPWDYDFTNEKYNGLVISNGPGNPEACVPTIAHIKKAFESGKPILGVCLGVQLLALAAGAKTYKLPFGHRSQNQPCLDVAGSSRCYITSQNHGYAVDEKTLPKGWSVWFKNANDGSVEGIRHKRFPWRAVQFHPEASPGPTDTMWIFHDFLEEIMNL